jgi:predicted esterase
MTNKIYKFIIVIIIIIHFALLAFCVKTNTVRGPGLEEARYVPAGVYHWYHGRFQPANDSPPFARMIAAIPLLLLRVHLPSHELGGQEVDAAEARERDLRFGGRFASAALNFYWYRIFCLARLTGFVWWLLGAWVIGRWSGELWGAPAVILALSLWCVCPNVLALEQRVIPDLSLAVSWAAATYVFRSYLRAPSWGGAFAVGLLLGVAELAGFASLALFLIWPLLALLHRLMRAGGAPAGVAPGTRMLRAAFIVGSSLWVLNLGYGFTGSVTPLRSFDFVSRILKGGSPPSGGRDAPGVVGNRFRGTWLGRLACPLPADYLRGLDRRLAESEEPPPRPGGEICPAESGFDPLAAAGERRPIGLWGMMLGSLILPLAGRRPGGAPAVERLSLWLVVGAVLLMTLSAVDLLAGASGILLMTPFAIIIASSLAPGAIAGPRAIRWVAALLSAGAIADGVHAISVDQMTPENRARFRRDVSKYAGRLGLHPPRAKDAPGTAGEHGLLYRTFVDRRGVAMNYALFVPRDYRGDRPYPLILFLHGHGDRGTKGRQFTEFGLPFTLEYREIDFLVVCPQGHSGSWVPDGDDARRAMELLGAVEKDYRVDPKRIYLTGISSGGTSVWELAAVDPRRWAAIVPVASSPQDPSYAGLIKDIPCWCFHNRYDGGNSVERVRRMIEALRAAGGRPMYTEYANVNHSAWDQAYHSPGLFDWLSRQHLP